MTAEQFVYWLQGYFEIGKPTSLWKDEIGIIKDHLALVLEKKTPVQVPHTTIQYPGIQYPAPNMIPNTNIPSITYTAKNDLICSTDTPETPKLDAEKIDKLMNEIQLPVLEDFNNITTLSNDSTFNRVVQ
jgi:hypothetical protein